MPKKYEYMGKGEKEARIGLDSEEDIINMINLEERFHNSIRDCLITLGFNCEEKLVARKNDVKTDIFIQINKGEEIGVSIKSSTRTSFHQLDRRRLEEWKTFLDMPDNVFETIKRAILRVAKNSRDKFILEDDRDKIRDFFVKHHYNAVLQTSFLIDLNERKTSNSKNWFSPPPLTITWML